MIVQPFDPDQHEVSDSAVLYFHFQGEKKVQGAGLSEPLEDPEPILENVYRQDVYEGEQGEVRSVYLEGGSEQWILFCGLGRRDKAGHESFRRTVGEATREISEEGVEYLVTILPRADEMNTLPYRLGRAFYEGLVLASYSFDQYQTDEKNYTGPGEVYYSVSEDEEERVGEGISDGTIYAEATDFARDLANEPAEKMHPGNLAEEAEKLRGENFHVNVMRKPELEELGMEPTLGVSAGSDIEPAQVELRYEPENPENPDRLVALVGKGITFDTGGLNLKSHDSMMDMKFDMAGAAAVLAVFRALKTLQPDVRVMGMLACSENMTGPSAQKMRDVVQSYGGKTIEITHTDAEGRLVMSDALGYAVDRGATEIIDVATLTGSIIVALGSEYAGMMTNDESLRSGLQKASEKSGENLQELPLVETYDEYLESPVADLRNTGTESEAGAIVAGLFLQNFVEDVPWAHLDIAGTGWRDDASGYLVEGGTGFPVRTLLDYLTGS